VRCAGVDAKGAVELRRRAIAPALWSRLRYADLGADFYDSRRSTTTKNRQHVRELEALGYRVTLEPAA
jgi:transposase